MKEKSISVLGILSLIFGLTSFLILLLAFITEIHNSFDIENIKYIEYFKIPISIIVIKMSFVSLKFGGMESSVKIFDRVITMIGLSFSTFNLLALTFILL